MKKLVKINIYASQAEGELAKGYLENNGIEARVVVDDALGSDPFFTSVTASGTHLYVSEKDAEKAKKLLSKVK